MAQPQVPLRRLFRIINGGTPTSDPANWDGDVQWATPVDLGLFDGAVLGSTQRTLTPEGLRSGSAAVPARSLILSSRAPIGYACETSGPVAFNQGCKGLAPWAELDVRYYRYVLASQKAALAAAGQGSTFVELSSEALSSFQVPSPSLTAQRAIADFLDTEIAHIDTLIKKKMLLAARLDQRLLEASRQELIGHHHLQDPLDVRQDELSSGWRSLKLGRHLDFGSGTTPTSGDPEFYGPGVPWIVTGDLRDREISTVSRSVRGEALAQYSALRVHPAGSLVVAMYGATVGRLGMTTFPATVNQACCVMQARDALDLMFLFFYLLVHREFLLDRSVGAGQPNISQDILRSLRIAAPALRGQRHIVEAISAARRRKDTLVTKLEQQIELLREHRLALITAAVTGQLDISEAA